MANHGLKDTQEPQVGWSKGYLGLSPSHTLVFIIVTRERKVFFSVNLIDIVPNFIWAREAACPVTDINQVA